MNIVTNKLVYQQKPIYQQIGHLGEIDQFLDTYNLPRLTHDETETLNILITIRRLNQ